MHIYIYMCVWVKSKWMWKYFLWFNSPGFKLCWMLRSFSAYSCFQLFEPYTPTAQTFCLRRAANQRGRWFQTTNELKVCSEAKSNINKNNYEHFLFKLYMSYNYLTATEIWQERKKIQISKLWLSNKWKPLPHCLAAQRGEEMSVKS